VAPLRKKKSDKSLKRRKKFERGKRYGVRGKREGWAKYSAAWIPHKGVAMATRQGTGDARQRRKKKGPYVYDNRQAKTFISRFDGANVTFGGRFHEGLG